MEKWVIIVSKGKYYLDTKWREDFNVHGELVGASGTDVLVNDPKTAKQFDSKSEAVTSMKENDITGIAIPLCYAVGRFIKENPPIPEEEQGLSLSCNLRMTR